MSLRPLLEAAHEDERFRSLAARLGGGASSDGPAGARVSATLRPFLLAALLEDDAALAGGPALLVTPDDRSARILAAELRSFLAPRRVRYYPSRGTGYASHVAPPPHLVGLRIDALDALRSESDPVGVASAIALAEAVPDASLRPAGFAIERGEEVDLGAVADDLCRRLVGLFLPDGDGRRPADGAASRWPEQVTFYEYFHGDTGAGLGASHQTGWTALVAKLIRQLGPDLAP